MRRDRAFLLLILAITALLTVALIRPFIQYVLAAVLLAYLLYPIHRRLAPHIGQTPAAFVLVLFAMVAIVLPLFAMAVLIAGDAMSFIEGFDPDAIDLGGLEDTIESITGFEVDLVERGGGAAESIVEAFIGSATDIVGAVATGLIGLGLTAFLLFFLIRDGDALAGWLKAHIPLPQPIQRDLYDRLDDLIWAVLVGHVVVAIFQGIVAGIGLYVAGVPNALFWTLVMIFLALIPAIGSFLVWAPAAGWLVYTGEVVPGVGLFIYGLVVVGLSDEFLRPLIVGRVDVSPSVIIVGVIGGLYLLGFMGLFFGPVIVGALKAIIETYVEWTDQREPTG